MDFIRQAAVFLMITSLLTMLVNSESYQKYVKIFSGLMLLLMLLRPVTGWLAGGNLEEMLEDRMEQFAIVEADHSLEKVNQQASETMKNMYEEKISESMLKYLKEQRLAVLEVKVTLRVEKEELVYDAITVVIEGNRRTAEAQQAYICSLLSDKYGIERDCIIVENG